MAGEAEAGQRGSRRRAATASGLPASLELAWGLRERPHKGPKRALSLERIVAAAVALASAEGLGAVSMSRVASELGAATMSLYRYVAAKDELLALMVDAAGGVPPEPEPGEDWRAGLSRWAWGYRARLREHPWMLRIPISGPPATPNQIRWLEDALRSMADTGLNAADKLSVVLLLSGYIRNEAALNVELTASYVATGADPDEAMASYVRLLLHVTSPERFPHLHAVLRTGELNKADEPDDEFIFGLDRVLDGVAVLVDAHTAARRSLAKRARKTSP